MKSGYISIAGRPSSGKSTLLNRICGNKVSIVADIPQTTRNRIIGIYNESDMQVIFLDTPGIHKMDKKMNDMLVGVAKGAVKDSEGVAYIMDITRSFDDTEKYVISILAEYKKPIIVLINKIDLTEIRKDIKDIDDNFSPTNDDEKRLFELYQGIKGVINPIRVIPISATEGTNIDEFISTIRDILPEGPMYYPEEYYTDQSVDFRISEIIREKIFLYTKQEIPYSTYVECDDIKMTDNRLDANCTIYVARDSQKGIIIGRGGSMIKKIRESSERDLEDIFGRKVLLHINVKERPKWYKKEGILKKIIK